jgi:hypothetical protein
MPKAFAKMAKKFSNLVTLTFDERVTFVESVLTKGPGFFNCKKVKKIPAGHSTPP